MPQYTYYCSQCHASGVRIVKLAERDAQFCEVTYATLKDGAVPPEYVHYPCGTPLVREGMELTALAAYSWKP